MIIARSPLRISLAGGGTDFRDYYQREGGATCSLTINKHVYVTINNLSTYFPHRFRIAYSKTELVQETASIRHPIVRETLNDRNIKGGVDINVMADIPAGTGMGSSSAFTVGLIHALNAFDGRLISKEDLAKEACRLEIDVLGEPIGKQDQYAAAFGGINLFRFHPNESVSVEPVPISREREEILLKRLMLFYLGGSRSASEILSQQKMNTGNNQSILNEMRDQASQVAKVLAGDGSLDQLGDILYQGWELKKKLAQGITNSEVDDLYNRAIQAGAKGGKLLGAGGTGFLLLYVPEESQVQVRQTLEAFPQVDFGIDPMGSTLLYYEQT